MHKQTIALIDDDRNILTSLSIALEKEGFKVQTYIDGESALIGLTITPPDLAVIDILKLVRIFLSSSIKAMVCLCIFYLKILNCSKLGNLIKLVKHSPIFSNININS